jgi:hypothetical protein
MKSALLFYGKWIRIAVCLSSIAAVPHGVGTRHGLGMPGYCPPTH